MPEYYSLQFVLFMVVTVMVYYYLGKKKPGLQWVCLFAASMLYYLWSGFFYIFFILVTALCTWVSGLLFEKISNKSRLAIKECGKTDKDKKDAIKRKTKNRKKFVLITVLLITFGILAFIKYVPESWHPIRGLLLPLGISFYTFQSVSYVIDSYNGDYPPEKNFLKFLLFISYFPQLLQGPINRFDELSGQLIAKRDHIDITLFQKGLLRIGYGLFKKYAIANLLVGTISAIFDNVTPDIPGSVVVYGILLYSAQQYADFSGGIDIAIGVSELFGIEMAPNFRQPYFSISLADFWRRWHISLGTWMRDYVFYPFALSKPMQKFGKVTRKKLGKHLGGVLPACLANILVFLVVGLWHGSASHNILWGLYNGIVIALSSILAPAFTKCNTIFHINVDGRPLHIFRIIRTFVIVNIGWYFDRIVNFEDCMTCFRNTLLYFSPERFVPTITDYNIPYIKSLSVVAVAACFVVFIISFCKEKGIDIAGRVIRTNVAAKTAIAIIVVLSIQLSYSMTGIAAGFLYANF